MATMVYAAYCDYFCSRLLPFGLIIYPPLLLFSSPASKNLEKSTEFAVVY